MPSMPPEWYKWKSQHLTDRTKAQDSYFILGWPEDPKALGAAGQSVLIDKASKQRILDRLENYYGIEATKLFPDPHGYARWYKVRTPSADFFIKRGIESSQQGKYEEAILRYNKAIALDQNNATAYRNRGYARRQLDQHEDAIEDYDQPLN